MTRYVEPFSNKGVINMTGRTLRGRLGRAVLAGLVVLLLIAAPGKGRSLELGLTPSHVYSLWLNINRSLVIFAKLAPVGEAEFQKIKDMQPAAFKGKKPADVYALAEQVQEKLRGYIPWVSEVPKWLVEYEKVSPNGVSEKAEITPSAVFLISMKLLNGLVNMVIDNTGWEQPVRDLYVPVIHPGKEPSDVYGLVDLALRRIELILASKATGTPRTPS